MWQKHNQERTVTKRTKIYTRAVLKLLHSHSIDIVDIAFLNNIDLQSSPWLSFLLCPHCKRRKVGGVDTISSLHRFHRFCRRHSVPYSLLPLLFISSLLQEFYISIVTSSVHSSSLQEFESTNINILMCIKVVLHSVLNGLIMKIQLLTDRFTF